MIDIKEKFLELTTRRYPIRTEDLAMEIVKNSLPDVVFIKDGFDNYYVYIPKADGTDSDTMFTSHLDTVDRGPFYSRSTYKGQVWNVNTRKYETPIKKEEVDDMSVTHVFEDKFNRLDGTTDDVFVKTDGETNLGADDKAGVVIMMNMISENVPGLYYFFMGEESGCVGSSSLSRTMDTLELPTMNKCIAFDRRGYDSIITSQKGICASNDFAQELSNRFNEYGFWFKPDPTGVYTDSAEFTDIISECTNISVGYFSEHTKNEKQDLEFLELLADTCIRIDWETLPIVREKDKVYTGKKAVRTATHTTYTGNRSYNQTNYTKNATGGTSASTTPPIIPAVNSTLTKTAEFEFDAWYDEQLAIDQTVTPT